MDQGISLYDKLNIKQDATEAEIEKAIRLSKHRLSNDDIDIAKMILLDPVSRKAYDSRLFSIEEEEIHEAEERERHHSLNYDPDENSGLTIAFVTSFFGIAVFAIIAEMLVKMYSLLHFVSIIFVTLVFIFITLHIIIGIVYMVKESTFIPKTGLSSNIILVLAFFPPYYFHIRAKQINNLSYLVPLAFGGYFLVLVSIFIAIFNVI